MLAGLALLAFVLLTFPIGETPAVLLVELALNFFIATTWTGLLAGLALMAVIAMTFFISKKRTALPAGLALNFFYAKARAVLLASLALACFIGSTQTDLPVGMMWPTARRTHGLS